MADNRQPPGPPGHFILGHLRELRRDVLSLYLRCGREYGPVAMLRFGLRRVWVVTEPDLIEQILTSRNFGKHYALKMNRLLLGDGLLTSDGDFWLRQRRLIQPAFLRDRLDGYGTVMVELAEAMASEWTNTTIDMHASMRRLTMQIAARTLFGGDVGEVGMSVAESLAAVGEAFSNRLFSVWRVPEWVPTPSNLRARRAIKHLDAILYNLIERRRQQPGGDDLVSILLHARDEGTGMTDKQLRDEAMTLFLAGHETTALALTYALDLLAEHQAIQDTLRQEIRNVLGDRQPTPADAAKLTFTELVVTESMRLRPPAYVIGRQAVAACELGGFHMPAGTPVIMPQWVVHRDPRYFPDPERFDPTRWADGLAKRIPKYAYYPFGGGPRVCIGNTFAMLELVLVLASLLRHWRVRRINADPPAFRPRITLALTQPIMLALERIS